MFLFTVIINFATKCGSWACKGVAFREWLFNCHSLLCPPIGLGVTITPLSLHQLLNREPAVDCRLGQPTGNQEKMLIFQTSQRCLICLAQLPERERFSHVSEPPTLSVEDLT